MDADDRRLLYRTEYDLLTLERRQTFLERVGEENGMTLLGFRRYERWGVYTYTAMYSRDGEVYLFVPGDEVTLGWSGEYGEIDPTTRSNIRMDLEERGCRDPEEIIRRLMTPERRVRIPPMLVQMSAVPFEGTYAKAVEALGGSLPTSDEWEYLCGGGLNTLFQWGDGFDFKMALDHYPDGPEGPNPLGEPNFFGLLIATDPFEVEAVRAEGSAFRGGDLGGHILSGYRPVIGYLSCSPHFKPISKGPDGKEPTRFLCRRVVRLDIPEQIPAVQDEEAPVPVACEEAEPGPEAVFSDSRPFPKDYVFCASIADDPEVPDSFTVRAQNLFRGLIYWIPAGDWTYAELAEQLRSRADRIASIQDETGYRMTPAVVESVRGTFDDILRFYGISIDPDSFLDGPAWQIGEPVHVDERTGDLLAQCDGWHESGQHERIVQAIESLPESRLTPALVSVLARAYNNLGGPDDPAPCRKAVELLESVRDSLGDDALWNYRMAYSYWMMDREPDAVPYLQRAVELDPEDGYFAELLEQCVDSLDLPSFRRCFRERAGTAWAGFLEATPEILRLLELPDRESVSEEVVGTVEAIVSQVLDGVAFEIGYNDGTPELVLSPEADRVRLFEIHEFVRRAPSEVTSVWSIREGRVPRGEYQLRHDGVSIDASDVDVLVERRGERVALTLHCPKLAGLMPHDEDRVWWMVSSIMEHTLGEAVCMTILDGIEVVPEPPVGEVVRLSDLGAVLMDMGFNMSIDAEGVLSDTIVYSLDPFSDPDADWRLDVHSGSSRCAPLVNGYLHMEHGAMDVLHRDGAVAGFLAYPLDSFDGDDRAERIMTFREQVESAILDDVGRDAVEFIGGATGLYRGYVDLIAWDIGAVIESAKRFFRDSEVQWAGFHTFRRGPASVMLADRRDFVPSESPVLIQEDIDRFGSYVGEVDGSYGAMLKDLIDTLNRGLSEGRFDRRQVEADLEVALWYSYACLNLGDYVHYWQTAQWMPSSEGSASACGTWFYRYSCALMYCGRLEEARDYAERGVLEEPSYPWIWLQAAKLRAHFGDVSGAIEAIDRGLEIVPGDYEFTVLRDEVEAGLDLDSFEFHWIDPGADAVLQRGEDPEAVAKRLTIDCILTDPEGAERFRTVFEPIEGTWREDSPYCSFETMSGGVRVDVVFRTNLAAVSKFDASWMSELRTRISSGSWNSLAQTMRRRDPLFRGQGTLKTVTVGGDREVTLVFGLPNGRTVDVVLDESWEPRRDSDGSDVRPA